jgi:hypothetical protein
MFVRFIAARSRRAAALLSVMCATFLLAPPAAHAAGPKISGTPPATIRMNQYYRFDPTATDPDTEKKKLRFSIQNKPAWLVFNIYSGRLEGKPTQTGSWSNIRIAVTDGKSQASLAPFKITVTGSPSSGAPTISGTPPTTVTPGSAYAFTPTAKDPNGDKLTFSVANKPGWSAFSTSTGRLSGTPTSSQVGTYSNIKISVSDGKSSASLPAFGITVADVVNGSATLSWTPPTRNTNGSALTNLAGYRIYYGTSATALNRTLQVANAGLSTYVVPNLSPATWYFVVRAYTTTGAESTASNTASKTVR